MFLRCVCQNLMNDLVAVAEELHKARQGDISTYARSKSPQDHFYVILLQYIHNWAETFTYLEGTDSEFSLGEQKLLNMGIRFPREGESIPPQAYAQLPGPAEQRKPAKSAAPAHAGRPQPIAKPEVRAEEIIATAVECPAEIWIQERTNAQALAREIVELLKALNQSMDVAFSKNEDVSKQFELISKLTSLQPLFVKAAQGNSRAAQDIAKINDVNPAAREEQKNGLPSRIPSASPPIRT